MVHKSPGLNTEGVDYAGCTVFCRGLDTMRKMKILKSALIASDITLYSADRRLLTVLGVMSTQEVSWVLNRHLILNTRYLKGLHILY